MVLARPLFLHNCIGVPHPVVFMPAAMPLIVARTARSTA